MMKAHIVIRDLERLYMLRSYLKEKTNWRVTWGVAQQVPKDSEVVLIDADAFAAIHTRKKNMLTNKINIVYGSADKLPTSFLLGCHDYIKLPWSVEEAYCRIAKFDIEEPRFIIHGTVAHLYSNYLSCEATHIPLTPTESSILKILIRHKGSIVVSHSMRHATTNHPNTDNGNEIRVHIHNIRIKLEALPSVRDGKKIIATIPRKGYLLQDT